jgi:polyhydroxyalkanoate synthase
MRWHLRAAWVAIGVLAASSQGRADDFGTLLERAAGDRLRQALAPRDPGRAARPSAPAPQAQAGEPFVVKTADGWSLVAHRYKPTGPARPGVLPVILCHGLTYNAQFWDLDPACSFARYLSQLGFDVWAVNLRGCGLSSKWVWNLDDAPGSLIGAAMRRLNHGKLGSTGFATLDPKYANWTMDHHIAYDVPAFVNLVRRQTGAAEVAWVGHSMGGIVALGCLARYQNPGIGRLVTVGSQVTMPEGQVATQFLSELLTKRQLQLAGQPNGRDVMTQTRTSVNNLFFNAQNVDPKIYEALTGWATDVPAIGLMQQYMLMTSKGELLDAKGRFNYARAIGNVKVPIFISCGEQDSFAPPKVQRYLYDHVGSADKTLFIFGRSQGLPINAGHDDSLVGLNSREATYPVIARWLAGAGQQQLPPSPPAR